MMIVSAEIKKKYITYILIENNTDTRRTDGHTDIAMKINYLLHKDDWKEILRC